MFRAVVDMYQGSRAGIAWAACPVTPPMCWCSPAHVRLHKPVGLLPYQVVDVRQAQHEAESWRRSQPWRQPSLPDAHAPLSSRHGEKMAAHGASSWHAGPRERPAAAWCTQAWADCCSRLLGWPEERSCSHG